jgi:ATP-dependent Clp protease protease subunit
MEKNTDTIEKIVSKSEKFDSTKYWIEHGIDIEKRRVMLDEDVDEYSVGWIMRAIRRMIDANKTKPIDVYINSYGGSIYDGLALYDFLRACSYTTIRTHASGKIMSMAFMLYLAGDERYSSPRARFMNHQGADDPGYHNLANLKAHVKELDDLENMCLDILDERTKKTRAWWKKEIEVKDKYYSKAQALKLGIVTDDKYEVE